MAEIGLLLWLLRHAATTGVESGGTQAARCKLHLALYRAYARPELHGMAERGAPEAFIGQLFIRLGLGKAADAILPVRHIAELIDARHIHQVPRSPYRMLEMIFALDALGIRHNLPPRDLLVEAHIGEFASQVDALNERTIYALLHTVFYATDFGGRPLPSRDAGTQDIVVECIPELLTRMAACGHWDLLAELVLARRCLRMPRSSADARAWFALQEAQENGGGFIGRMLPEDPASTAPSKDGSEVLTLYHRCLVAAMAGLGFPGRQSGF